MEQKLEDELNEIELRIEEVKSLMRVQRVDEKLKEARLLRDKHEGNMNSAYLLDYKKSAVSTTMHTQTHLALGDIMKTKIKICQFPESLDDTLKDLSEKRLALLEQMLKIQLTKTLDAPTQLTFHFFAYDKQK